MISMAPCSTSCLPDYDSHMPVHVHDILDESICRGTSESDVIATPDYVIDNSSVSLQTQHRRESRHLITQSTCIVMQQ